MSLRRMLFMPEVPSDVRRAFHSASEPESSYHRLWLEVAARATLDALGLTTEHDDREHNKAIREARRFFRFHDQPDNENDASRTFENANIELSTIRAAVLSATPTYRGEDDEQQDQNLEA